MTVEKGDNTSGIAISLTPEQVNQFLATAVLNSQLGATVEASIQRVLGQLNRSYDNPFDLVIRQQIIDIMRELMATKYRGQLEERLVAALSNQLSEQILETVIQKAVASVVEQLSRQ